MIGYLGQATHLMTTKEILRHSSHRPWPLPSEAWQYYQEWNKVVFLHWQADIDALKEFVPDELEIDLFDGHPWVSLVAFTMEDIRTRSLPAFPPISNFHEINIRTYVRSANKTGVYFLNIEGGKRISCSLARRLSGLPYRFSEIKRSRNQYLSLNRSHNDHFCIDYVPGKVLTPKTEVDLWLTERYALFQDCNGSISEFETHHLEWPLSDITISSLKVDYPRFNRLMSGKPDRVQYSEGVQVVAWAKDRLLPPKEKKIHDQPANMRGPSGIR